MIFTSIGETYTLSDLNVALIPLRKELTLAVIVVGGWFNDFDTLETFNADTIETFDTDIFPALGATLKFFLKFCVTKEIKFLGI